MPERFTGTTDPIPVTLYHYTTDKAARLINETGVLMPGWGKLVWLTTMPYPRKTPLGLTSHLITVDRTKRRFRVTDIRHCEPWLLSAHRKPELKHLLEGPGTQPSAWWVSERPVPVTAADRVRHA